MAISIQEKSERYDLLMMLIRIINPREKPTAERMRCLNGRYKDGYETGDFVWAARAFSRSEWHKANNQMTIDNLLRPSKFGRWYNAGQDLKETQPATQEDRSKQLKDRMG